MYIPTYKQIMLLIVGLVFVVSTIAKISHVRSASRSSVAHPGGTRAPDSSPLPPIRAKQALVSAAQGEHGVSVHDAWYLWLNENEQRHAESISKFSVHAFCRYLKDILPKQGSPRT